MSDLVVQLVVGSRIRPNHDHQVDHQWDGEPDIALDDRSLVLHVHEVLEDVVALEVCKGQQAAPEQQLLIVEMTVADFAVANLCCG